ncbi:hypothetical protein I3760_03G063700 [Carya illinoinensis]|nr:hypothetical protein I3760_03G063700 [Carya illinoinensis]
MTAIGIVAFSPTDLTPWRATSLAREVAARATIGGAGAAVTSTMRAGGMGLRIRTVRGPIRCRECCSGWVWRFKRFLEQFKAFSFGYKVAETGEGGNRHLCSGELRELGAKTSEKPMKLVCAINWASNSMKLVTKCLEGTGILGNRACSTLHQLKIVFETNLASFGSVTESIL